MTPPNLIRCRPDHRLPGRAPMLVGLLGL